MKKTTKTGVIVIACSLVLGTAACSSQTEPDKVGLYYAKGDIDGYKFKHCTKPGGTDDVPVNDEIIYLPTNLRTWNIMEKGGDSADPIVVSSKPMPDEGQPSGIPVKVWSGTSFYLNTYCDDNGGTLKAFWEKIGRRYNANKDDGWHNMLTATLVPPLQKAEQDIIRKYSADELVGNIGGVRAEAQQQISILFAQELNRLAGGDFFCGPKFDRQKPDCPSIEMTIIDVDFADGGIQEARNKKQKAVLEAAATVADAQGKVDAANKLSQLYKNEAWLALELANRHLQEVQACSANPNCTIIFDSAGNTQINNLLNPKNR